MECPFLSQKQAGHLTCHEEALSRSWERILDITSVAMATRPPNRQPSGWFRDGSGAFATFSCLSSPGHTPPPPLTKSFEKPEGSSWGGAVQPEPKVLDQWEKSIPSRSFSPQIQPLLSCGVRRLQHRSPGSLLSTLPPLRSRGWGPGSETGYDGLSCLAPQLPHLRTFGNPKLQVQESIRVAASSSQPFPWPHFHQHQNHCLQSLGTSRLR